jgi:hypothetical protein
VLLGFLLFVPLGCGEDDQRFDADDPRAVVARYIEAVNDKDVATVCELITDHELSPERCETGFTRQLEKFEFPEVDPDEAIGDVTFTEEDTAQVENLAVGADWELVRRGDEWRLHFD